MKSSLFSKIVFAALLGFTLSTFLYFSFGNIYSSKILNHAAFSAQFDSGIYRYRILSNFLLFQVYDVLSHFPIDYGLFKIHFLHSTGEPQMLVALYVLNTFFLMLASAVMVLIAERKNFVATEKEKLLLVAVAIFAMVFSQFVIVPYDVSAYFFLLIFYYFLLKFLENPAAINFAILVMILMVSATNRETAALSVALSGALLFSKYGFKKKMILPVTILAVVFVAVYCGLRIFTSDFTTNDGNLLQQNLTEPKNFLGLLFWLVFFVFTLILARDRHARRNIILFHMFAVPYLLMCFYTGILYEIRLYIPLFLTSLFLGQMKFLAKSIN